MTQSITQQTIASTPEEGADVTQSFLSGANHPAINQADSQATLEREPIKHTLIGSSKAVTATIRSLHQLRYAEVGDWSPLLPTGNTGEVMSILVRSILV
ncbi:hypothetical protein GNE08_29830 (plasmid) [Trichormus variabilis ARAD]|nr:hypothetical protein [Trichormus variabilis ARAD]MBC1259662.1 hypothetical protein [Trichormus variabilis V5]MBC1271156.1 hypothetical protein [Trichormus variabilis FSR]MBC1306058.1 hypothetical protein [Trichormus variabilis N2B]MBC1315114.1 hypothetical protein [Trichormus variabilis PNB]MBC1330307.1 hypothetical protein [Trichormus variabilis 9RC]MBD2383597.1 hypothetical protein [Trichormus variabilis FACHB-319]QFZ15997.1 hypothetical protein EH233_24845 [Anabaena sp. YBS01]QHD83982